MDKKVKAAAYIEVNLKSIYSVKEPMRFKLGKTKVINVSPELKRIYLIEN
jgi:hypothetical protein